MTERAVATAVTRVRDGAFARDSRSRPASRWRWFLVPAVVLLLGAAGMGLATFLKVSSVLVFGPLLLASGIVQGLIAFIALEGKDSLLHLIAGGVEGILGLLLLAHPLDTVIDVVVLIAIVLIVSGLVRLTRSLAARSRGRSWIVLTGVVTLLLGVVLWSGRAGVTWWVVGLCLAVDFFCHGASWTAVALTERKPLAEMQLWPRGQ